MSDVEVLLNNEVVNVSLQPQVVDVTIGVVPAAIDAQTAANIANDTSATRGALDAAIAEAGLGDPTIAAMGAPIQWYYTGNNPTPSWGQMGINAATPAAATIAYFNAHNSTGLSLATSLALLTEGAAAIAISANDDDSKGRFIVTGVPVQVGEVVQVPIEFTATGTNPVSGWATVNFWFIPAGATSEIADADVAALIDDADSDTRASLDARFGPSGKLPLRAYGAAAAAYVEGGVTRMKWLTFGDSVAQGVFEEMYPALSRAWGGVVAGVCFAGSSKSITATASSGAVNESATAYDAWPTGLVTTFAAGASRTWGVGGAAFTCDTITVYYIKEPGAGTFKLQVDGVDAPGFTNVSAAGTLGDLGVATISTTRAAHTVTLVGLTGTVRIPSAGVLMEDSTVSGVVVVNVSKGGLSLADASTATALSNFAGFLADLNPTVLSFEMKDTEAVFAAHLATFFDAVDAGAPDVDVLAYLSAPLGSGDADQIAQNAMLAALGEARGYTVYDEYGAFGSYSEMLAKGFIDGGELTHYNSAGKQFIAALVLRDLDLLGRVNTGAVVATTARIESGQSFGADPGDLVLAHSQVSGFDMLSKIKRAWTFVSRATGTADANSWVMRPDNTSDQQIPLGVRLGDAGPWLRNNGATVLRAMTARSGGANVSMQARGFIADVVTLSNQSGAVTLDLSLGSVFLVNLTGNVTSWAFSNAVTAGHDIEVHFIQDATGSRTLAGKAGSIVLAGGALTLTTTASKRDVLRFRFAGGAYVETARSMNVG